MKRIRVALISLLLLLGIVPIVNAQMGTSLSAEIEKKLTKGLTISAEGEFRWTGDKERLAGTLEFEYKVNKYFKAGVGYSILHKYVSYTKEWQVDTLAYEPYHLEKLDYGQNRHRFFAYLTGSFSLGAFKLSLRERYQFTEWQRKKVVREEHYTYEDYDDWNEAVANRAIEFDTTYVYFSSYPLLWKQYDYSTKNETRRRHELRSRIQLTYAPKRSSWSPYIAVEFFNILNPRSEEKSLDDIRYIAGVDYKIKKRQTIGAYYNFNDLRNSGDGDESVKHRVGISYKLSF